MRRAHSSRSCVRFCRRWATISRSNPAEDSDSAGASDARVDTLMLFLVSMVSKPSGGQLGSKARSPGLATFLGLVQGDIRRVQQSLDGFTVTGVDCYPDTDR